MMSSNSVLADTECSMIRNWEEPRTACRRICRGSLFMCRAQLALLIGRAALEKLAASGSRTSVCRLYEAPWGLLTVVSYLSGGRLMSSYEAFSPDVPASDILSGIRSLLLPGTFCTIVMPGRFGTGQSHSAFCGMDRAFFASHFSGCRIVCSEHLRRYSTVRFSRDYAGAVLRRMPLPQDNGSFDGAFMSALNADSAATFALVVLPGNAIPLRCGTRVRRSSVPGVSFPPLRFCAAV